MHIDMSQPVRVEKKIQTLTGQQNAILDHPPTKTLIVEAGAGTGKTSTLVEYSKKWSDYSGLYVAFNAAIAEEAKRRFPPHVRATTAHSYAYKALNVGKYKDRLVGKIRRQHIREAGINCYNSYMSEDRIMKSIIAGIENFTNDAGKALLPHHCGLEHSPKLVQDKVMPVIANAIQKFLNYDKSSLPFTHDCYLKRLEMYGQMGNEFDYIMVDEAQDLSPVLLSLVQGSGKPIIAVGDPKQCLAPGQMVLTPNGLVAIENLRKGNFVVAANGEGKTKSQKITDVYVSKTKNGLIQITTKSGKKIVSTPNHTHFAGFQKNNKQDAKKTNFKKASKAIEKHSRKFSIVMCGVNGQHKYTISGDDLSDAKILNNILNDIGIKIKTVKNSNGWHMESTSKHLGNIYEIYKRIQKIMDITLNQTAHFSKESPIPLIRASNCHPGMELYVRDAKTGSIVKDEIASVEQIAYQGLVYDINVEFSHNFIANDIVTHNSIYAFRNAIDAMTKIDGPRLPLSQSWRFGTPVDALANHILSYPRSKPQWPIEGRPGHTTKIELYTGQAPTKSFILARTNARLFQGLVNIAVPFHVAGGFEVIASQLLSALALSQNDRKNVKDATIQQFSTWEAMVEEGENDDMEIKRLVKIITEYGNEIPIIIERLRKIHCPKAADATIILSTAHKAKGLEADTVIILDDFPTPAELQARRINKKISAIDYDQEFHLAYVAMTRGMNRLLLASNLWEAYKDIIRPFQEINHEKK